MADDMLNRIINAFPGPVLIIDNDFQVLASNKTARATVGERVLDWNSLECHERSRKEHAPRADAVKVCSMKEVIATGAAVTIKHNHTLSDGCVYEINLSPFDKDADKVTQYLISIRGVEARIDESFSASEEHLFKQRVSRVNIPNATAREQSENALHINEARFRGLFEKMLDAFALHEFIYSDDGTPIDYVFLAVNASFEKMTGLKSRDVIGKTVREVIPDIEPFWIETYSEVVTTGEPKYFENYSVALERHYEVLTYRTEENRFACIFKDITKRKLAEESKLELERQVQQAQKLESLGILAGGVAHDFNNLLTCVLGNADLALLGMHEDDASRKYLYDIVIAAERAAELANQMLAYSGKGRFIIKNLDICSVIREMAHLLETTIPKKVLIKYEFAEKMPLVEADPTQMQQIIMNLIMNASEAIENKSGVITIRTGFVECDTDYLKEPYLENNLREGIYSFLEITDTGSGMDKETIEKIFDPFFTTRFTGRGLGLAAVLGIVRGHKGVIKVESRIGKGTSVRVLFPSTDSAHPTWLHPSVPPPTATDLRLEGKTVLLVDDEERVRSVCEKMLNALGVRVVIANDGKAAVERFRQAPHSFDCVILDLTMPVMDGEEAFQEMKRIRSPLSVILASGYNEQDLINRFAKAGFAGFIQKPYRTSKLKETLLKALYRN